MAQQSPRGTGPPAETRAPPPGNPDAPPQGPVARQPTATRNSRPPPGRFQSGGHKERAGALGPEAGSRPAEVCQLGRARRRRLYRSFPEPLPAGRRGERRDPRAEQLLPEVWCSPAECAATRGYTVAAQRGGGSPARPGPARPGPDLDQPTPSTNFSQLEKMEPKAAVLSTAPPKPVQRHSYADTGTRIGNISAHLSLSRSALCHISGFCLQIQSPGPSIYPPVLSSLCPPLHKSLFIRGGANGEPTAGTTTLSPPDQKGRCPADPTKKKKDHNSNKKTRRRVSATRAEELPPQGSEPKRNTMTRHGKNCTAGAVYTYHEKRKDTAASGYGTQSIRLGKDAIKDFDCCCLSLQPCQSPVVTPDGYLYEKQAILEYILHQKMENAKKMKSWGPPEAFAIVLYRIVDFILQAYEKQKQAQKSSLQLESKSEERQRVERFKSRENSIVSKPINPFTSGQSKESEGSRAQSSSGEAPPAGPASASTSTSTSTQSLPSFWIPSLTPEAKPTILKKPSKAVLCPMSGRAIRMNELIPVRFTPLDPSLDRVALLNRQVRHGVLPAGARRSGLPRYGRRWSLAAGLAACPHANTRSVSPLPPQERYVCAVTRDVLGNSVPCAVLRPSGSVVTQECVEKLIKKDMTDPVTGDTLSDKDIIPLQRVGSALAPEQSMAGPAWPGLSSLVTALKLSSNGGPFLLSGWNRLCSLWG
ncbi:unnamed protein product [Menidia menidia]|uniref:Nitric oxide synthase-interacting protein n=1 Tax=Menidia menidia TaxID=238744 RepID=A0A8S4AWJ9_9TELE|nr:unnamed protein product [Menidia menidia]